jgi:hypothetical protein
MIELIMGGGFIVSIVALIGIVTSHRRDTDKGISRVYERIDETRERSEEKYRTKDVCREVTTQVRNDLTEIKADVKLLLRSNGVNE